MIDLHIQILFSFTMSSFYFVIPGIMFKYSRRLRIVQIGLLELHLIKVYVKCSINFTDITLTQLYLKSYHKIYSITTLN